MTKDDDVCESETKRTEINVTLLIHLSEHVLVHVPYIVCTVSRLGDDDRLIDQSSEKVFFQVKSDIDCTVPIASTIETTMNATETDTTNACYSMQYKICHNSILFSILCLILMSDYYT